MQSFQAFTRIDYDCDCRFPVPTLSCLGMYGLCLSLFNYPSKKPFLLRWRLSVIPGFETEEYSIKNFIRDSVGSVSTSSFSYSLAIFAR